MLKNWYFFRDVFWMVPFFNIDSTSFVTNKDSCADIFGWCGTFFWNGSKMKSIFRPDNHSKILGWQVSFFQCFPKYCSLPARGKLLTFTFEISFAPIGVYALTGVMKLFLINLHLKVVEEQFPCYRFLPCCVFFNWGIFLLKKVDFLLHFLTRESSIFIPLTATILPLVIKVFCKCCKLPSILFWKWGVLIKGPFVLFWTLKAVSFFALFLKLCGFFKVQSDLCNIFGFLLIQYNKKDIQSSITSNRIECLTK